MAVVCRDYDCLDGFARLNWADHHQNTLLPFYRISKLLASSRLLSKSTLRRWLLTRNPRQVQCRQQVFALCHH